MARFYTGQPVRIKSISPVLPEFAGKEARFVGYGVSYHWRGHEVQQGVFLDCTISCNGDPNVAAATCLLEPIQKNDDEVGSWDALEELGLDVDKIKEAVY